MLAKPKIVAARIPSRRLYALDNVRYLRVQYNNIVQTKKTLSTIDHDILEEILEEIDMQKRIAAISDDLEDFCEGRPDEPECRVYDF